MNLALDFDNTYTRDPQAWNAMILHFRQRGHKVYVVTMRYDKAVEADPVHAALYERVDQIYFTGRKAKRKFMFDQGISIDVWIDDQPDFILHNARA